MDFEFDEDLQLFRRETRAWVDRETPKAWARELEKHEHEWPFELFDKFTAAGFHGVGIDEEYGGQGGRRSRADDPRPRACPLARRSRMGLGDHLVRGG